MRVILIDDENLALEVLSNQLEKVPEIKVVGMFTNPEQALREMPVLEVDVVFLDIEMGAVHGLEFAQLLLTDYQDVEIVFVTAHSNFALKAFEVNAIDYLLKPVTMNRLEKTVEKLRHHRQLVQQSSYVNQEIRLQMLRSFQLYDTNNQLVKWRTKKAQELFAYLLHHNKQAHKSNIIEDIWPEMGLENASSILHTSVYHIRKVLKTLGFDDPLSYRNSNYVLNINLKSDVDELEALIGKKGILSKEEIARMLTLYQADYLVEEGYHWVSDKQLVLQREFLAKIEAYVSLQEETETTLVESCLDKMLELDPYNEDYMVMSLVHYSKTHQAGKVEQLFTEFEHIFTDELGLPVPDALIAIYEERFVK